MKGERPGMTWLYLLGALGAVIVLLAIALVALAWPSEEDRRPSS